jgi:hypothetical protein
VKKVNGLELEQQIKRILIINFVLIPEKFIYKQFSKMSNLIESLESIKSSIQKTRPYMMELFAPGLKDWQIDEITKNLPFCIPSELRDLYKWSNGFFVCDLNDYLVPCEERWRDNRDMYPFFSQAILPLERAVKLYEEPVIIDMINSQGYFSVRDFIIYVNRVLDFTENTKPTDAFGSNCLQLFFGMNPETAGHIVIIGEIEGYKIVNPTKQESSQVILTCKRDEVTCRYNSLTAMMQTFAEWYKQTNGICSQDRSKDVWNKKNKLDNIWHRFNE